ncbi:rRNA pseudouridine synthase [Patescibacteria group bacterium]|nr:rRNA pseudouridine synthase [Patescibacteria group bacterium]
MINRFSTTIKLQKVMAQRMGLSRRSAEKLIEKQMVVVNGQPAHIGQRVNPTKDKIQVVGKDLTKIKQQEHLLVHKPVGLVTTKSDELGRPTIMSLIPEQYQHLFPVGRLDLNSEGLILMTNDGELSQVLTHPKFKIEKTYQVLPNRKITSPAFAHLKRGMKIDGRIVKPVDIHRMPEGWITMTITSGQKHIVRKMLKKSGYETDRLIRTQFGPLELGDLESGKWRELTREEITTLKTLTP